MDIKPTFTVSYFYKLTKRSRINKNLCFGATFSLRDPSQIPGVSLFLREDPENEAAVLVRRKGGGNDGVLPRREPEALTHLPGVDEGAHGHVVLTQQHIRAQVDVARAFVLTGPRRIV